MLPDAADGVLLRPSDFAGRQHIRKAVWQCRCGHQQSPSALDMQARGVWVSAAGSEKSEAYIDEEVLAEWDRMKNSLPNSSLQGFLSIKQKEAMIYGCIEVQCDAKLQSSALRVDMLLCALVQ